MSKSLRRIVACAAALAGTIAIAGGLSGCGGSNARDAFALSRSTFYTASHVRMPSPQASLAAADTQD